MTGTKQRTEDNRYINEYVTIKIPRELLLQCENIVEKSNLGFTSRTDVVKTAIRNFLIENNGGNGGNGGNNIQNSHLSTKNNGDEKENV